MRSWEVLLRLSYSRGVSIEWVRGWLKFVAIPLWSIPLEYWYKYSAWLELKGFFLLLFRYVRQCPSEEEIIKCHFFVHSLYSTKYRRTARTQRKLHKTTLGDQFFGYLQVQRKQLHHTTPLFTPPSLSVGTAYLSLKFDVRNSPWFSLHFLNSLVCHVQVGLKMSPSQTKSQNTKPQQHGVPHIVIAGLTQTVKKRKEN